MRTLVIETATAACSVALIEHGAVIAATHEIVGRGHAERLLPMIAALPDGGHAAHILVDCGPGSFTGIRVGLAAARALAFAWGTTLGGYSSLALVAAATVARDSGARDSGARDSGARDSGARDSGAGPLAVVLEGGHGEVFMQSFDAPPLTPATALVSLAPAAARARLGGQHAVGDGLRWLQFDDPRAAPRGALPDAADALLLPPALAALPPVPLYGRAPDATPPAAPATAPR